MSVPKHYWADDAFGYFDIRISHHFMDMDSCTFAHTKNPIRKRC